MSYKNRVLFLLFVCAAACGGADTNADGHGLAASTPSNDTPDLFLFPGASLWSLPAVIPVCFEYHKAADGSGSNINPTTLPTSPAGSSIPQDWATLQSFIRNTFRNSWGRAANIEFTGFGVCPGYDGTTNAGQITITFQEPDDTDTTDCGDTALGYQGSGTWTRMRLDTYNRCFPYANRAGYSVETFTYDEFKAQIMHELGHALGFAHEVERSDETEGCNDGQDYTVTTATVFGTPFDVNSIMNYTYCTAIEPGPPYFISPIDTWGVQNAYGRRTAGTLVASSGGCLDLPLPYTAGSGLQIYPCNNSTNEQWSLATTGLYAGAYSAYATVPSATAGTTLTGNSRVVVGRFPLSHTETAQEWEPYLGGYQIRGIGDMCLDIPGGSYTAGQNVQIYTCNGGTNQLFKAMSDGTIRPVGNTAYCLDAVTAVSGNHLLLETCSTSSTQQFTFADTGEIKNSGFCMDTQDAVPTNGKLAQIFTCKATSGDLTKVNQLYHLTLTVESVYSGLCMEVSGSSSLEYTSVIQDTCNTSVAGQQWDYYFKGFTYF